MSDLEEIRKQLNEWDSIDRGSVSVELENEDDPNGNVIFKNTNGAVTMVMPRSVYESILGYPIKTLDKHTFGNFPIAINLADILSKLGNKHITSKVSSFYIKHLDIFRDLKKCNSENKDMLLGLVQKDIRSKVNAANWPNNVKTHLLHCLSVKRKQIFGTWLKR